MARERFRHPWFVVASFAILGCKAEPTHTAEQPVTTQAHKDLDREAERRAMVSSQLEARGVRDERVLAAMREVPRHELVPVEFREYAYEDRPLPIGYDQTISQPFIVAAMTEAVDVTPGEKVLEIGTGSGYQAAVLAAMGAKVYSIEIVCELADRAAKDLERLGYGDAVESKWGDGYVGWPEHGPFDAVIVTAAPPKIPQPLIDQLAPNGRLVVPEGDLVQELVLITKDADGKATRRELFGVRFVPMTGEAEKR